ncbi:MAG: hypothetical protein AAGK71_07875 [Pseudomonadota bacterium]
MARTAVYLVAKSIEFIGDTTARFTSRANDEDGLGRDCIVPWLELIAKG